MNDSRFPGTAVFRSNNAEFMVSNHYVSSIPRFCNATVCPLRDALVVETRRHSKRLREKLPDECPKADALPSKNVVVDQWTTFQLENPPSH